MSVNENAVRKYYEYCPLSKVISTPCPMMYEVKVGSFICVNHCEYFCGENVSEQYV